MHEHLLYSHANAWAVQIPYEFTPLTSLPEDFLIQGVHLSPAERFAGPATSNIQLVVIRNSARGWQIPSAERSLLQSAEPQQKISVLCPHRMGILVIATQVVELFPCARDTPTRASGAVVLQHCVAVNKMLNHILNKMRADEVVAVKVDENVFIGTEVSSVFLQLKHAKRGAAQYGISATARSAWQRDNGLAQI